VPKVASTRRPQTKPKMGQHFLASEDVAARVVDALGDVSQCTVLEIGPGRGILTSLLAKRARRLIAVELDRVLAAQLRLKFGMSRNVEVIEADVLSIDFDSLFGPKPGLSQPGIELKPQPVKVVGNLPYYITSDILLRLFEFAKYFDSIVIMVQREVADRIAAKPGGSDYGGATGGSKKPGHMTDVGQGDIDWKRIFAKSDKAGIQHYFVENDEPKSPFEDIKISYDYLAKLTV